MKIVTETQNDGDVLRCAGFGPDGALSMYRYTLRREWRSKPDGLVAPCYQHDSFQTRCNDCREMNGLPLYERAAKHALFMMLNPSTADAFIDDPTVAKCMRLARRWGFGAVEVRNIFALRSTDPAGLYQSADPVGPENNRAITEAITDKRTGLIVAAWGNHGTFLDRGTAVVQLLRESRNPIYAFTITKQQQPAHPLYQPEAGLQPENLVRFV